MRNNFKSQISNLKLFFLASAALAVSLSLSQSVAFGAEAGGEHGSSPLEWVWRLLNFGVLVFLLVKFAGKPLKEYLAQRKELIGKSIKEAQEAKELAKKALAEVEERLRLKDKEIEDIVASAKHSGGREKERLLEESERLRTKILEQAKANIDYEVKRAKETIKAEAVEAAMRLAEEKIRGKLTPQDQEKLLKESLSLLSKK